ncbi:MAG TPA: TRAP transporter substrate-binding protein DctP [Burkholderiaceae bacterium]|jgi:TRAP-type C4-dicarboxylate transport system substrate-binding protein|nr:TRAP transporter substrate-binding protein DctP [Burkholderiaceae bacterium]
MDRTRRRLVQAVAGASAVGAGLRTGWAAEPRALALSHQFPPSTGEDGDFRDRLCRRFAADVERRTSGALKITIYPNSSLMKTKAQISALRKGALDLGLVPLPYAGGEIAEANIGLMPGVVSSYEQGSSWKELPVGRTLAGVLADKGIMILTWVWQAGGVVSRTRPIVEPGDAKGLKVRGGSPEMEMVLKAAGAAVTSVTSDEIYAAMQTGVLDAAMTSSTSLISYRLEEVAKQLTTGRGKAYWFMLEPLLMSRNVFETLPKNQQDAITSAATALEPFGVEGAKADDQKVAMVYQKAGGKVYDLTAATVDHWRALARDTAWKDFAARSDSCARLMKLAEQTMA